MMEVLLARVDRERLGAGCKRDRLNRLQRPNAEQA